MRRAELEAKLEEGQRSQTLLTDLKVQLDDLTKQLETLKSEKIEFETKAKDLEEKLQAETVLK